MGALHDGHLSLTKLSRQRCSHTIATIFVNPTQFGPGEDLDKYPRTVEQDCQLLRGESVDAVFIPDADQMYPAGCSTFVQPPDVAIPLEGECRPDHFRGVATIVMKLFQILPVTHGFFGRKDYQQLKVIQAMVRDLNVGIEIVAGETVREADGLALSSRNRYLNDHDRSRALLLSTALQTAEDALSHGERDCKKLQEIMHRILLDATIGSPSKSASAVDRLDYAVVVNSETLMPITRVDQSAVALIAAFVGETRLIDNRSLSVSK
jgi:pantoate--beta-alanine ligase